MTSDYYGSIAGEIADEGAEAERAYLAWLNEYTRREAEPGRTAWDEMRAAFLAGVEHGQEKLATPDMREPRAVTDLLRREQP